MQYYKVTKSVTINGFKVDPTRSSQHFCLSLTTSANPSSSLSLLTCAGDPGWFAVLSQMLSCQPHIQPCCAPGEGRTAATWGSTWSLLMWRHLQLFPGYFSIRILTVHLMKFQRYAMQFLVEATLPHWWILVTLHHHISTTADNVKITVGVSTTR